MSAAIHKGDLVMFRKGIYPDETGAVYRVLELNGNRCFIDLANTNMVIRPKSVASLSDLEPFVDLSA